MQLSTSHTNDLTVNECLQQVSRNVFKMQKPVFGECIRYLDCNLNANLVVNVTTLCVTTKLCCYTYLQHYCVIQYIFFHLITIYKYKFDRLDLNT